jgi:hypothetical protein
VSCQTISACPGAVLFAYEVGNGLIGNPSAPATSAASAAEAEIAQLTTAGEQGVQESGSVANSSAQTANTQNANEIGVYSSKIKWGIRDVNVRPAGAGFWGQRMAQGDSAVNSYELQINPNNESYYLPHPGGGYVQFENLVGTTLQDGKLVTSSSSIYMVQDLPLFAQQAVLKEATRQVEAASANSLSVEWLVSNQKAADQLDMLFRSQTIPIMVIYRPVK